VEADTMPARTQDMSKLEDERNALKMLNDALEEHVAASNTTDEFVADCTQANKLSFYQICRHFEILYNQRKSEGAPKRPVKELVSCLLPETIYRFINGTSFFPLLRLILPDLDTSRPHTGMKE
jgi:hypothetical protein